MASFHRLELLKRAVQRDGLGAGLKLIWQSIHQAVSGQRRLLFAMTGEEALAIKTNQEETGFTVTCYENYEDISPELRQLISENGRHLWWNVAENLGSGAKLWVGTVNGTPLSFAQTRSGETIDVYFFPMTEDCILISHCVTLPEARGQGLYMKMLRQICCMYGALGARRLYIDCTDFNLSSARGIRAAGFHDIGRGIHFRSGKLAWFQETPPSVSRLSRAR